MVEIALASINSFASPVPTVDFIQALLVELSALRDEVVQLREDIEFISTASFAEAKQKQRKRTTIAALSSYPMV